jgi:hypothetical protein
MAAGCIADQTYVIIWQSIMVKYQRCLLDLSAAFGAVDHELLLSWLQRKFGIVAWHRTGSDHSLQTSHTVIYGSNLYDVVQLV